MELGKGKAKENITFQDPTASDNSGDVTVACEPPSQSEFNIGMTTVTCTARDGSGNVATCEFQVDVRGRSRRIHSLISNILHYEYDLNFDTSKNPHTVRLGHIISQSIGQVLQ